MSRPAQITIDLSALRHNLQQINSLAPHSAVLAMVKSNAYGHGLTRIGLALENVEALGVACLEEAKQLRDAGVRNAIVLMEGLFRADEIPDACAAEVTLIVHQFDQVEMLEESENIDPLPIWIKIDTGMHRLGFAPHEFLSVYQRLSACAAVKKPIGFMTHFAQSDSRDKTLTQNQIDLFKQTTEGIPGPRSLANSGAIITWPSTHADWVRPGIMLYGVSPFAELCGHDLKLKPVMSLTSELISVHDIAKGERISYGGQWVCPEDMRVGVVAIGYGDGYPWHAENGTPILVNNKCCSLVGRVTMDMLCVDLRSQPNAKIGDPVTLWGPNLPVETVAQFSKTIAYELLTRTAQRVRITFKE